MNETDDQMTPGIQSLEPNEEVFAARAESMNVLLTEPEPTTKRKTFGRPSKVAATVFGLLLVTVGFAAATGVFSAKDVAVGAGIGCYSEPSLQADTTVIIGPDPNPVQACAELWRQGVVDNGVTSRPAQLTACTADDEPVRVFPSGNAVCADLHLVPLPADYFNEAASVQKVDRAIAGLNLNIDEAGCASPAEVARSARAALTDEGVNKVSVMITGQGECARRPIRVTDDGPVRVEVPTRTSG